MSPEVTAAIIAAGVGVLTVAATVAAQVVGRRATSQDTQKAFKEQREQLNTTLAAQREQLDKTLGEQRTRTLNERFAAAAGQLGSDKPPEVRLAGVYAMAGLADDWPENRQTCVDVLCAYLRMPYEPDPGDEASEPRQLAFRANREVRHTVIRVITAHLRADAMVSWQGLNFDFTGVFFDGGDFTSARFSGGTVSFDRAEFCSGSVDFRGAEFSGGTVRFDRAEFSSGSVDFRSTEFSAGGVSFDGAVFSGCTVNFSTVKFSGGEVSFTAEFSGGTVRFHHAAFSGGVIGFRGAGFSGGLVSFYGGLFSAGAVYFTDAGFSGGEVSFRTAVFSGSEVDFSDVGDWSSPPAFPWTDTPPPGVKLPGKEDQSHA